jgi:hypothetical protein
MQQTGTGTESPAWPYCYQCDGPTVGACTRCGRFFCAQHGGERTCWRSAGPGQRGRFVLRSQILCDVCRPNQVWMRVSITVLVALALAGTLVSTLWLLRFGK